MGKPDELRAELGARIEAEAAEIAERILYSEDGQALRDLADMYEGMVGSPMRPWWELVTEDEEADTAKTRQPAVRDLVLEMMRERPAARWDYDAMQRAVEAAYPERTVKRGSLRTAMFNLVKEGIVDRAESGGTFWLYREPDSSGSQVIPFEAGSG